MKKILFCVLAAVTVYSVACKKKSDPPPTITEVGNWEGKYSTTRVIAGSDTVFTAETTTYAMILKSGGLSEVFDGPLNSSSKATGTYTISGDDITVIYAFGAGSPLSARAKINSSKTAIVGKWYSNTGRTGGSFHLFKK